MELLKQSLLKLKSIDRAHFRAFLTIKGAENANPLFGSPCRGFVILIVVFFVLKTSKIFKFFKKISYLI